MPARATVAGVELSLGGGSFAPRFWAGVNLGATIPGHDPGELAIPRSEYDRWLSAMGTLGVRVIRVYTLLRPAFYEALAAYDRRHPRAPLWLLQGIYLDQGRLDSHRIFEIHNGSVSLARVRGVRIDVAIPRRRLLSTRVVRWPSWNTVRFAERRKASWPILVRAFHLAAPWWRAAAAPLTSGPRASLKSIPGKEAHV